MGTLDLNATTATPPRVVHEVTRKARRDACLSEGYEDRPVDLASAPYLLRSSVADLDCVRVAEALADISCCPVCVPGRPTTP